MSDEIQQSRGKASPSLAGSRLADEFESPPPYTAAQCKDGLWVVLDGHNDSILWSEQELPCRAAAEALNSMRFLCRIKLPVPVRVVADLADLFPGQDARMRAVGGYLEIYSKNAEL